MKGRTGPGGPSTRFLAVIAPLVLALGLGPAPASAQPAVEAQLRAAEEQLASALVAKDEAAFERLLAPTFVLRGSPDVTRDTWIANALKLCWGDAAEIGSFRVAHADADRAVVTLVLTTHRDPVSCERATLNSLITDVWERGGGGWQLVLRHSGPAGGLETQFAKMAPPPPTVEGTAELSLVDTGGNTETQTLGTSGSVIWRPGVWTTEGRLSFVRSVADGVETAETFTASVRQARSLTPRLDVFARAEHLANRFAGIDNRLSVDAGLGYRVLEGPVHTLRADAGLGYSRENRLEAEDLSFALATIGATYRWTMNSAVTLSNAPLLTASLQDAGDWRFRNTLAVTTTLVRELSIKLSHELNIANAPAPGFGRTDTALSVALVLGFRSPR